VAVNWEVKKQEWYILVLGVRGFVRHSIIHKENPKDATVYQNILFHIYMKLNMFRATHLSSSGA